MSHTYRQSGWNLVLRLLNPIRRRVVGLVDCILNHESKSAVTTLLSICSFEYAPSQDDKNPVVGATDDADRQAMEKNEKRWGEMMAHDGVTLWLNDLTKQRVKNRV